MPVMTVMNWLCIRSHFAHCDGEMLPGGEQPAAPSRPAKPATPSGGVGRHRGRRGGRGRRRPTSPPAAVASTPLLAAESAPDTAPPLETTAKPAGRPEPEFAPQGSAIRQAIDEVMQITDSLRHALEQMEEVLELVELAERQKLADEREIESLRRALRQLQRPRGPRPPEDESHHS